MRNTSVRFFLVVASCTLIAATVAWSQSWAPQQVSVTSHFSAVSFFDDLTGVASGAYGVIVKTIDGGAHWTPLQSGIWSHFSDQYFVSPTTGWVVGQYGVIVKTTNGGATWTPQASGTNSWLNVVQFKDALTGWAAGENGTIVKTTNGGATWTTLQCGTTATIEGGWFKGTSSGFAVCTNGMVLRTQDGGSNWTMLQSGAQSLNAITFAGPSVGWAVGGNGKILKSVDGGATWSDQVSGTTRNLNAVSFATVDKGWAVGDYGTVLVTTNGGVTWSTQNSTSTENLRSVFFVSADHGYAVGLNNTILEYAIVHALPVQLASFTAAAVNDHTVRLDWRTISEVNNYGFEVERSTTAAGTFEVLAGSFVAGHGTTNEPQRYSFSDESAMSGRLYYRLRQRDLDGTVHYSDPVAVDVVTGVGVTSLPVEFSLKQNYPNPFNPSTTIEFSIPSSGVVSLKVFDLLGREVATIISGRMEQGEYTRTFSGADLASGVYLYMLSAGNQVQTRKFVLAK